jgi:hypothetical protein
VATLDVPPDEAAAPAVAAGCAPAAAAPAAAAPIRAAADEVAAAAGPNAPAAPIRAAADEVEDVVAPAVPAPATAPPSFVYALGQLDARFPSLAIEKELAQVTGRLDGTGLTSRQVLKQAISDPRNRYLARSLCWVLTIGGLETYIVVARDPFDLQLLVDAYREHPSGDDLDVVVGVRGGIAPPEMCNGLALPVVVFDQLYSFDRDGLIESIPRPASLPQGEHERFGAVAREQFDGLIQVADNAGALDEHRALNYLTVRYPRIYEVASEKLGRNFAFTGVEVLRSSLSGVRTLVDVVFTYTHRETDVAEREFVRVDVTEEFPFLARKMGPYTPAELGRRGG